MDNATVVTLVVVGIIVVAAIWVFLWPSRFRTLIEYQRIVVFSRTGRLVGVRGPGIVYLPIWTAPRPQLFDLRDQVVRLTNQHCIALDSAVVQIEPVVIYKVAEPHKVVTEIQNPEDGIISSTTTTLHAIVGEMRTNEVITRREEIASNMVARVSEQVERWGIQVISIEIQDLKPDPEVERAMNQRRVDEEKAEADLRTAQLRAESARQQYVVEADARRQGSLADSEATKTQADAEKYAIISKAEGEREAEILRAQGVSALYSMLGELGSEVDVALKYEQIQALRTMGESANSKLIIVPANLSQISNLRDVSFIENALPESSEDRG